MGKYSNVKVKELQNAVNIALREINSHNLSNIKLSLSSKTVLQSNVSSKVSKTINSIVNKGSNGNLSNLKSKLTVLKTVSQYIVQYQKLEEEIEELEDKIDRMTKGSISSYRRRLSTKKAKLKNLESQIDNLLSKY